MTTAETPTATTIATGERADLLDKLTQARFFLRFTTRDLDDEQAARRTTVSRLCLGGLIKHAGHADIIRESLDGSRSMG